MAGKRGPSAWWWSLSDAERAAIVAKRQAAAAASPYRDVKRGTYSRKYPRRVEEQSDECKGSDGAAAPARRREDQR